MMLDRETLKRLQKAKMFAYHRIIAYGAIAAALTAMLMFWKELWK